MMYGVQAFTDLSAARGIFNRKGLGGRVKHMATRLLWLQELVLLYASDCI